MFDEEACLPGFIKDTDSYESSDAGFHSDNETRVYRDGPDSYIKKLGHVISYLIGGKDVSKVAVGEGLSDLEGLNGKRKSEELTCGAGNALCKGLNAQRTSPHYSPKTAGSDSRRTYSNGSPLFKTKATDSQPESIQPAVVMDDKLPTSISPEDDLKQTQALKMIVDDQKANDLAMTKRNSYSSFIKDGPTRFSSSGSLDANEPSSREIMPPIIAAMLDTEVDEEETDVSGNDYNGKDLSTGFPTKLGLMGGAKRQNLPKSSDKAKSASASKPKPSTKKAGKTSKPVKSLTIAEARCGKSIPKKSSTIAKGRCGYKPSILSTNDGPLHSTAEPLRNRNNDFSPESADDEIICVGTESLGGDAAEGQSTNDGEIAPPLLDPFEEEWHDQGPSHIYLADNHFAANMISAEIEWDLAQGRVYSIQLYHSDKTCFSSIIFAHI